MEKTKEFIDSHITHNKVASLLTALEIIANGDPISVGLDEITIVAQAAITYFETDSETEVGSGLSRVKIVQDCSDNLYIIPLELLDEFYEEDLECLERDDYEIQCDFVKKWAKYNTNGDMNSIQLYSLI
jgi:hypothetical protein